MCGQLDMNVPLINSEQLYQALRRVGKVETELVDLPEPVARDQDAELPEGPARALPRVVRPLPAAGRRHRGAQGRAPRPQARGDVAPRPCRSSRRRSRPSGRRRSRPISRRPTAELVKDPESADAAVWLGRRYAYLGRYREAIDAFTRGLAAHPRRRAAAAPPRPPLHHDAPVDKAARRPDARRRARRGEARTSPSRAPIRRAPADDDAAVRGSSTTSAWRTT